MKAAPRRRQAHASRAYDNILEVPTSGVFGTWSTIALKRSFGEVGSENNGDASRKMSTAFGSHKNILNLFN